MHAVLGICGHMRLCCWPLPNVRREGMFYVSTVMSSTITSMHCVALNKTDPKLKNFRFVKKKLQTTPNWSGTSADFLYLGCLVVNEEKLT